MLGFNSYESNVLTDTDSATLVQALRQASKNIMYTVANSGNYTVENPDEAGLDNMTLTFIGIDVAIAAVLTAVELIVVLRWRRKLGKAADGSRKNRKWNSTGIVIIMAAEKCRQIHVCIFLCLTLYDSSVDFGWDNDSRSTSRNFSAGLEKIWYFSR